MVLPKIMVVDDSASFRQVVMAMLQGVAGEFVECRDGIEAVRRYASEKPDCVLMDLEMGNVDGLMATRELLHQHPGACIIILSQHDDNELQSEAKASGALEFVAKDRLQTLRQILQDQPLGFR